MKYKYPFKSELDNKYYFWIGDGLAGPYKEYEEAHSLLTAHLEGRHGEEKSDQEESK